MQNVEKKPKFAKTALIAYAFFLLVFAGVAFFQIRGNRFISPDAVKGLLCAFCIFSIPWWLFAGVLWCFKNKKHWALKAGGILLLVIALIATGVFGSMLMMISLNSATNITNNYLQFDPGVTMEEKAVQLFPKGIPEYAEKPFYYYSYSPLMGGLLNVQGTWQLPEGVYQAELERVRALLAGAEESLGEEGETVLSLALEAGKMKGQLYAAYRDEDRTISYYYWRGAK